MRYATFNRRSFAGLALLTALCLAMPAAGAESVCDPGLPLVKDPMGYHQRGDRCEGIYAQQVSAVSIEIRSLVAGFGPFDPAKDSELVLAWTEPPGNSHRVRLRAFSLKPRTYYRMDTAVPAAGGVYHWPADVLGSVGLGHDDLGLVAWIDLPGPGGISRPVYLPLRAGSGAAKAADGYEVTIMPTAHLREVRVTLSRLDAQGNVTATLRKNEELGYGYYPSGEPTEFSTGKLGPAGFYRLAVTAVPRSGNPIEQEIELYHPGD